ncbi:hypothetical protein [Synechocystis sp. LEGE 06083]|nr:hypothetical protein [Synechocystis sp. LEGE 06083]
MSNAFQVAFYRCGLTEMIGVLTFGPVAVGQTLVVELCGGRPT